MLSYWTKAIFPYLHACNNKTWLKLDQRRTYWRVQLQPQLFTTVVFQIRARAMKLKMDSWSSTSMLSLCQAKFHTDHNQMYWVHTQFFTDDNQLTQSETVATASLTLTLPHQTLMQQAERQAPTCNGVCDGQSRSHPHKQRSAWPHGQEPTEWCASPAHPPAPSWRPMQGCSLSLAMTALPHHARLMANSASTKTKVQHGQPQKARTYMYLAHKILLLSQNSPHLYTNTHTCSRHTLKHW